MFENFPNHQQPDKRLKKSKHSGRKTPAAQHVNNPDGIDGNIADACHKDHEGKDQETENITGEPKGICKKSFHGYPNKVSKTSRNLPNV